MSKKFRELGSNIYLKITDDQQDHILNLTLELELKTFL